MYLQEKKIPKWKQEKAANKNHSFDSSLTTLGINGAFLNAKEVSKKLKSPTPTRAECCEEH